MSAARKRLPRLTPREKVLEIFPEAFSEKNGEVYQIVTPLPFGKVHVLGVSSVLGDQIKDAWKDALHRLQEIEQRMPTDG